MSNLNRRQFLGHGAALSALLAAGPTLLAACSDDRGSDNPATGTNATPVGVASVQLSGAKDAQFAGSYLADANGYYTKAGFEKVDLLPGGPDIGVETVVGAGTALLGYTSSSALATAVAGGAKLRVVAALVGKKVGIQSVNQVMWAAMLDINKIDAETIRTLPVQFDPTPLVRAMSMAGSPTRSTSQSSSKRRAASPSSCRCKISASRCSTS